DPAGARRLRRRARADPRRRARCRCGRPTRCASPTGTGRAAQSALRRDRDAAQGPRAAARCARRSARPALAPGLRGLVDARPGHGRARAPTHCAAPARRARQPARRRDGRCARALLRARRRLRARLVPRGLRHGARGRARARLADREHDRGRDRAHRARRCRAARAARERSCARPCARGVARRCAVARAARARVARRGRRAAELAGKRGALRARRGGARAAMSGFSADWLTLREPLDAESRAQALSASFAARVRRSTDGALEIVDLGAGTGANLRYLAPLFGGAQHWRLLDDDPALLDALARRTAEWAEARGARCARDGARLAVEADGMTCRVDAERADLAGDVAALALPSRGIVTASALLDLVSAEWLEGLAASCRAANASALFALTYDGRMQCL